MNVTIKLPESIGGRFFPTDNKSAFIREAIKEKMDRRDSPAEDENVIRAARQVALLAGLPLPSYAELLKEWAWPKIGS